MKRRIKRLFINGYYGLNGHSVRYLGYDGRQYQFYNETTYAMFRLAECQLKLLC